jgi:hypothetical protein
MFNFSYVDCKEQNNISVFYDCNINDFKNFLSKPNTFRDKNDLPLINPYIYTECNEYVHKFLDAIGFNVLFLDYDGEKTIDEVKETFKHFEFFLYTSFNHNIRKDFNGNNVFDKNINKFRVVLPLDQEYNIDFRTNKDYRNFLNTLSIFNGVDTSTFTLRGFYIPSNKLGNYRWYYNTGKKFTFHKPWIKQWHEYKAKIVKERMLGLLKKFNSDNCQNNEDAYGLNLMRKYKRTITQRCNERGTGVHAAMCKVNAGLANAKVDRNTRVAFMNELFQPTRKGEQEEIENIAKSFG